MKTKMVLSLSGGLDSSVLLAYMQEEMHNEVIPVSFHYGSKHGEFEQKAAGQITKYYGLLSYVFDAEDIFAPFKSNLLLSGGEIPEGHYESESMKQTVVPGRNMIFASILAGFAQSIGASAIVLGVHAGDHAIYPDCRPAFIGHMRNAIEAATDKAVTLHTPFLHSTKADIVKIGLKLKVPFQLTRTCYKQQKIACGKCGSCNERLAAFTANHSIDPIQYEEK
jgi:7-cyano-7-deazaguanine synthase